MDTRQFDVTREERQYWKVCVVASAETYRTLYGPLRRRKATYWSPDAVLVGTVNYTWRFTWKPGQWHMVRGGDIVRCARGLHVTTNPLAYMPVSDATLVAVFPVEVDWTREVVGIKIPSGFRYVCTATDEPGLRYVTGMRVEDKICCRRVRLAELPTWAGRADEVRQALHLAEYRDDGY